MYQKTNLARHIVILVGLSVWSLSLMACGRLTDSGSSNGNAQSQKAASPAVAANSNTSSSSPAPAAPAGPVLASTDGDRPGMRVEVVELKRASGDTINLKFTMINDSDKDMSF